jgi:hypothetical protein
MVFFCTELFLNHVQQEAVTEGQERGYQFWFITCKGRSCFKAGDKEYAEKPLTTGRQIPMATVYLMPDYSLKF